MRQIYFIKKKADLILTVCLFAIAFLLTLQAVYLPTCSEFKQNYVRAKTYEATLSVTDSFREDFTQQAQTDTGNKLANNVYTIGNNALSGVLDNIVGNIEQTKVFVKRSIVLTIVFSVLALSTLVLASASLYVLIHKKEKENASTLIMQESNSVCVLPRQSIVLSTAQKYYNAFADKSITPKAETVSRTHIVKQGDTLWKIAEQYLGKGRRYTEIVELNGLKSNALKPGQVLQIPKK